MLKIMGARLSTAGGQIYQDEMGKTQMNPAVFDWNWRHADEHLALVYIELNTEIALVAYVYIRV